MLNSTFECLSHRSNNNHSFDGHFKFLSQTHLGVTTLHLKSIRLVRQNSQNELARLYKNGFTRSVNFCETPFLVLFQIKKYSHLYCLRSFLPPIPMCSYHLPLWSTFSVPFYSKLQFSVKQFIPK